jgi:hypothetical protein
MAMLDPASEVRTARDGWTWLRPRASSLKRVQLVAWAILAFALAVGSAGVVLLPALPAVIVALVALGVALLVARVSVRGAHTRVGVSDLGLLVQMGPRVLQASWSAVGTVRLVPRGARCHVLVVLDGGSRHQTAATFDASACELWLDRATEAARAAGRSPRTLEYGAGFTLE